MYKKNFKRLKLHKNRPRDQSDQTHNSSLNLTNGPNAQDTMVLPESNTSTSSVFSPTSPSTATSTGGIRRTLSLGGVVARVETLLRNMSSFLKVWIDDRASVPWLFSISSGSWYRYMLKGFTLLSLTNADNAWVSFTKACEVARRMMNRGYNDLLLGFVTLFSQHDLSHYADVRIRIIRYLSNLAAARLGCQHPLTIIFFHFLDEEVSAQSIESALQMLIKLTGKEAAVFQRSIWVLEHARCCRLIDEGRYELAQECIPRLFKESHNVSGSERLLWRTTLLRQGDISLALENVLEAQGYYEQSINLAVERHGHPFPDALGIEAVKRLAKLHASAGDFITAQELCKEALNNPWTPLSEPDATGIRAALKTELEETMKKENQEETTVVVAYGGTGNSRRRYYGGGRGYGGGGGIRCREAPCDPPG
jgi:tetratricopeptide (TPR) repeat protein